MDSGLSFVRSPSAGQLRRQSLRVALLRLVLASLVPLVLVTAAFLWMQWDMHRTAAIEALRERVQALALAVERELGVNLAILETLAALPEIDARDWAGFHAVAAAAIQPRALGWIVLVAPSGQMLINTQAPIGTPLPNLLQVYSKQQEIEWQGRRLPSFDLRVFEPVRSGRASVTGLFYGPVAQRPVLSVAVPVRRDGESRYALNMGFTPDALASLLAGAPGTALTIILDGNGRIIGRSVDVARFLGLHGPPPFDRIAALQGEGVGEGTTLEGVPVMYAYRRLSLADWTVVVALPRQEIFAPVYRTFLPWLVATLLLVGIGIYLAQRLQRRLVAPLTALAASADALQHGETPVIPATRIHEVDTLCRALQRAAQTERTAREELERRVRERTASLEEKSRQLEETAAALRANEAQLDALIDNTPAIVFMKDLDGRYVLVNRHFARTFELRREELIGKTADDIFPPVIAAALREDDRRVLAAGAPQELEEVLLQAGEPHTYFAIKFPVRDADGRIYALCGIATDITERKRTRHALEQALALQRAILDSASYAIIATDPQGTILTFNPAAERMLGYAAAELVGQATPQLFHDPAEMAQRAAALSRELGQPIGAGFEVFTVRPRRDQLDEDEWTLVRKDGARVPVLLSITVLRDAQGEITGYLGIVSDITERKRAQAAIEQLNRALAQRAAELEGVNRELESFSYSVSHDLRAPLRSIDGFSQVLLEDYAERLDEEGRDSLRRVRAASQRMAQLIDDILKLSRLSRAEMRREPVDLSAIARSVADELRAAEPEREVEFVIADGVTAAADARLLRVVLENLLGNAWKYTARHPRARIEFGTERGTDGTTVYFVRDDGAGFDMAYAGKLFGAFQRLHSAAEFPGTGVGLTSVQRIVHRHGGQVWAEGAVEGGATFRFTLPDEAATE